MSKNEQIKKLGFWELDRGRCGLKTQAEFEQACITARDRGVKVTVNLSITVFPPDVSDSNIGGVTYQVKATAPVKPSKLITTELRDGIIINEGEDLAALLQGSLDLPMPSVNFKKDKGETAHG
jgi:hypothetical protein